jgi:uncharacterized protein (DUF608 family)
VGVGGFFYSGPHEGLVLDCYRLAKFYGRNPREFLDLTCEEIQQHMDWTARLIEASVKPETE